MKEMVFRCAVSTCLANHELRVIPQKYAHPKGSRLGFKADGCVDLSRRDVRRLHAALTRWLRDTAPAKEKTDDL